ncbi:hypothetical protein ARMGADRAFT_195446 [Armillaria gallica]|uniref:Heterokaryon incompatibility domain-containing protein n=1 Tax=Armillaria gallica TaxID=47427 RepID=A0A2H3DUR9_ARMGA|nr:hypothetical protein ARMGADRAFT_195446 [Armillaria gallica]
MASVSSQNTDIIAPSEPRRENTSSTSEHEEPILEAISGSLTDLQSDLSSTSLLEYSHIDPVDEQSTSNSVGVSDDDDNYVWNYRDKWDITLPRVTISGFTETGEAEAYIKVPKQRSYTGQRPVIPSYLADTPCAGLGVQGILDRLNATLGTHRTLDSPYVLYLLEECIEQNYDFGTVYGRLRTVWNTQKDSTIRDELRRREEIDRKKRQDALVGNRIINPRLDPRRVWDLYSNRVVPYWITDVWHPHPISHAWVDEKDRVDALTPINGKEWPVPIPKDASLNLIRIEMLNLGLEYVWLDVLCLRQKGGLREDLRAEEWRLDVPTIGWVYRLNTVVIYLSGLGRPLSLKEGDLDSDRSWFRRAWTFQEIGFRAKIIAGDTPDGPIHAKPIDDNGNYERDMLTRFHNQLKSLHTSENVFSVLTAMQDRVSTNPVDKVARLAQTLSHRVIPAYYESRSLEDAWTALMNIASEYDRAVLLFQYPGVGLGCKKWRPTWDQVMTEPMPAFVRCIGEVWHDDETDEDWVDGVCIEKGLLQGLDTVLVEGIDRWGELTVKDVDGMVHTFKIRVTHQFPIPKDVYTLLHTHRWQFYHDNIWPKYWAVGRRTPEQGFQKVSVFVMDNWNEVSRLNHL